MDFPSNIPVPNRISKAKSSYKTKIIEFEAGNDQRHPMWHRAKIRYELTWQLITLAEYRLISTFFDTAIGQALPWTMTDSRLVGGVTALRFASDDLDPEYVNAKILNLKVEVITC